MNQTVLIVEDETTIRKTAANYLTRSGFHVLEAADGRTAIEMFNQHAIDLVILDVMMPVLDGWTVLRKIRNRSDALVIMLTALGEEDDKLLGFELGADEYVTKPFSPKVLVARVRAMLTRRSQFASKPTDRGSSILTIDNALHQVSLQGIPLNLTPKEYMILECLIDHDGQCMSRDQILNQVWGYDFYGDSRVVDTHIKNLRVKLGDHHSIIQTVTGFGYTLQMNGVVARTSSCD